MKAKIKKSLALLLVICIALLGLPKEVVAETYEDDDIRIDVNPTSVTLSPGESTVVQILFTNKNDQTENIYIEYIFVETFGLTQGELSETHFQISPNGRYEVELKLTASGRWFNTEDTNDGGLLIFWGTELNTTSSGYLDWGTEDDSTTISIEVTKNMTIPLVIVVIIISILILMLIIIKKRRKKDAGSLKEEEDVN